MESPNPSAESDQHRECGILKGDQRGGISLALAILVEIPRTVGIELPVVIQVESDVWYCYTFFATCLGKFMGRIGCLSYIGTDQVGCIVVLDRSGRDN